MANNLHRIKSYIEFSKNDAANTVFDRLSPKKENSIPEHVPQGKNWTDVRKRWDLLNAESQCMNALVDNADLEKNDSYNYRIENFIGTIKIPVGLAGPLRINGINAQGDYYVPLATLEPTLVASYSRGSQAITHSGGCSTLLFDEGVTRTPAFEFSNVYEASQFLRWIIDNQEILKSEAEKTTRFGKLVEMKSDIIGKHVFLYLQYTTGDASGQNMVTIATQALIDYIDRHCPFVPVFFSLESNMSGDKKATMQSLHSVRGRKVTAEVVVPADVAVSILNATPEKMVRYYRMSVFGGVLSGSLGIQGHAANALTALYLACGQDAACVSESAAYTLNMDLTENGDLYAALTLPNIMVGTVGWTMNLPSQKACLDILGINGDGDAVKLAEICAAVCLAGDLSISAALSVGEFAHAHKRLARLGS